MVSVAADDIACVLMNHLAPLGILVPILPSRCGHDDEEAQLVAGVHKRGILWVVSCTDNGHAGIAQAFGIAPLLGVRQGIAHIGKVLMAIAAYQLMIGLAIEPKTVLTPELSLADACTHHATINRTIAIKNLNLDDIQIRRFGRPEMWRRQCSV